MAVVWQQPSISVLRGGCSADEQGKGVTSVWQSSITLCILSILFIMLQMCVFCMCVYKKYVFICT